MEYKEDLDKLKEKYNSLFKVQSEGLDEFRKQQVLSQKTIETILDKSVAAALEAFRASMREDIQVVIHEELRSVEEKLKSHGKKYNPNSSIPIDSVVEAKPSIFNRKKIESHQFELVSSFSDMGKADSMCLDLPSYNSSHILYDRGKEFRISYFMDKYLEDFISKLNCEDGYSLYLLIVKLNEFLNVSSGVSYTRMMFDRGKEFVGSGRCFGGVRSNYKFCPKIHISDLFSLNDEYAGKFVGEVIREHGYRLKLVFSLSNVFLLVKVGDNEDASMLYDIMPSLSSAHCARVILQLARENEFGSAQRMFGLMPCSSYWSFHENEGFVLLKEWIYEQLKASLHFILLFDVTQVGCLDQFLKQISIIPVNMWSSQVFSMSKLEDGNSWLHICSHVMIFVAPKGYYQLLHLSVFLHQLKKSYRRREWLERMMGIQSMLTTFIITNGNSVVCFDFSWCGKSDIPFEMLWSNENESEIVVGPISVECLNSKLQHGTSQWCASEVHRQIAATLKCKMSWTRNIIVRPYELQWVIPWKLRITSNPYTYVEKIYTESGRLEFMLFPPDVWNVGIILRFRNSPTILQFLVSFKRETIWFVGLQSVETAITMVVMTVGILIVWPSYQRWRFKLLYIKLWSMGNEILTRLVGSKSEKHPCVMAVGCRVMGIQFLIMGSQIINVYLGLVKKYWRLKLHQIYTVHLVGMGFTWVYYTVPTLIRRIYMREGIRRIALTEFQYIMMLHVSVHVMGGIHSFLSQIMAKPQFKWRCLQPLSSALCLIIGYNQVVGVCYFQLTRYLFHYRTHFSRNYPSSTSPVCLFTSWYKGNGGGTVFPCMVLSGCVRLLFSRGRSHKFISWNPRSEKFSTTGLIADLYREESAYWLFYMVDQSGTRGITDMRVKFNCLSTDLWKMRIHLATVTVRLSVTLQWTVYFMLTLTLFHLWDVISGCGTSIFEIVADYKLVNILVATENRRFALQGIEDKAAIFFVADSMKTTILRCGELVQHCHLMRYGHMGSNKELLLAVTVFAAEYDKVVSLLIQKMIGEASREALVQVVCEYQFNIHEKEPRQCHNPHVLEVFSLYGMEPGHGIRVHVLKDETVPSNIRWTKGLTHAVGWESGWMHPLELTRTIIEVQMPTVIRLLHKLQFNYLTIFEVAWFISISLILEDKDDLKEWVFVMSQLGADPPWLRDDPWLPDIITLLRDNPLLGGV